MSASSSESMHGCIEERASIYQCTKCNAAVECVGKTDLSVSIPPPLRLLIVLDEKLAALVLAAVFVLALPVTAQDKAGS